MIKIAKNENNEDNNVIKDKAKQVGGKIIKTVGFTALKIILPVVLIVILLAGMIWFIFDDLGTWGKEEKGRPNIYTQNVKMDPKEGIIIDREGLIKQVLLDYGYTEEEIAKLTEQEIIDKLLLSKKLNRTIKSLDDCTNAEILWCLSEDYSKFIDRPEQLEYLLNAELITQYPYIDGLDESKTNGVIKFYRYSNTGDVDFKSGYANAGKENQEEVVEEEEENDDSAETIDASKIFYIGDSWMAGLSTQKYVNSEYFWPASGKGPKHFVDNFSQIDSKMKNDASAIVVMLGLNATSDTANMQKLIDLLVTKYPDKQLYVLKVFHVGSQYKYGSSFTADKMNASIDTYNSKIEAYCSSKENVLFVDTTIGLLDGNGYLADQYLDKSLPKNDKNFHLNKDGYQKWYYNIEQALKAGGSLRNNVTGQEVYRIKYTSEENFDSLFEEYENSGNRDVFKYFTMDSEGNVVVATWTKTTGTFTTQNGNKSIGEIQSLYDARYQQTGSGVGFVEYTASKTKINYKTMSEKYTIPFEYLWALLVEGEDYDFVERISNLAYNTEFNIGIYDSVTTSTKVDKNYYTRVVTKTTTSTNKATGEVQENKTSKSIQCVDTSTIVTETDSITYDVAYANTWIVEIWTKYVAKNFNEAEEKDVTIMENQKGNLSEQDVIERLEKLEEDEEKEKWVNTTEGEEVLINSANREETVSTDTEEYDNLQVTEQSSVSNAYEYTEPEIKEKIDVDPNTGDNFVKALRESENAYRLLTNRGTIEWLCEVLENNEDTANMVDLTRALIIKARNPDAEIDFDFSIFKPTSFINMSSISGQSIGWEWTCSWENSSLWNFMHGRTSNYNSTRYIYECVTEDKTQYIMHDDIGTGNGNRNFGFGVCFYSGSYRTFMNQSYFAERGVNIESAEYQSFGVSKIDVEIADSVSLQIWQEKRDGILQKAQNIGVELEDYQLDALIDITYQYGYGKKSKGTDIDRVLSAYKQYGLNESAIKNSHPAFRKWGNRSEARIHLFMTGEYKAGDGNILNVADFSGEIYDADGGFMSALLTNDANKRNKSNYGNDAFHVNQLGHRHRGLDIGAAQGTKIIALGSGTVEVATFNNARGYYVRINHGNGYCTLYQHCHTLNVSAGQTVKKGQVIATVGNTGQSYGAHLHLEVWVPHGQGDDNWGNKVWDVTNPEKFNYSLLPN